MVEHASCVVYVIILLSPSMVVLSNPFNIVFRKEYIYEWYINAHELSNKQLQDSKKHAEAYQYHFNRNRWSSYIHKAVESMFGTLLSSLISILGDCYSCVMIFVRSLICCIVKIVRSCYRLRRLCLLMLSRCDLRIW